MSEASKSLGFMLAMFLMVNSGPSFIYAGEAEKDASPEAVAAKQLRDRLIDHAFLKALSDDARADVLTAITKGDNASFMAACAVLAGHPGESHFAKEPLFAAFTTRSAQISIVHLFAGFPRTLRLDNAS